MSETPVFHHAALGIHPACYINPTAPILPDDVLDGVLWLDTSSGPPHVLSRWSTTDAAWYPLQADVSTITGHFGYPLLPLIEGDVTRLEAWTDPVTTLDICILFVNTRPMFWAWSGTNALTGEDQFGVQLCNDKLMLDQNLRPGDILVATGGDATLARYGQGALGEVLQITDVGGGTTLPRWGGVPVPVAPVPVPTSGPVTCTQLRCGASKALEAKLEDTYNTLATWLGVIAGGIVSAAVDVLLTVGCSLTDLLTEGLGLVLTAEEIAWVTELDAILGTITAALIGDVAPSLSPVQQQWLQNAAFDALRCDNGQVQLDYSQMEAWYTTVLHAGGPVPSFAFVQQEVLFGIIGWGRDLALTDWAAAASLGARSPITDCDSWS